ncbi:ADP-ribosylglycohydrolase [Kribbella aluminosa]|uniref:ADP-ribosylglycohydrolase n=1 Tax=Kribbella aluminosa TaxID=416017 RepID=A0ABS4UIY9_9ACTN|nr:ADP-ribosylglycohydrolase family protein [Kribbella aluminosa]MBP2351570.1 ADP-ribosylglycohydrolase [Kribbella aluminosa]
MPEKASTAMEEKATGVLAGAAVGDAIGGAVEGWTPEAIRERHGGWVTGIVGPWYEDWRTARPIAPYHKGDGHITDDTLMTHALVEVYDERRAHLDAYAVAESLVPKMLNGTRWVPELEADALLLQRVFLAEKWLVARLHYGHVDPREAGVGNIVNCGAAMYMAPVGIANAGDPEGAYAEALDVAGAHQSSYGREAAGVFAAAVAAAMAPGATPASAVGTALGLAKDGTRRAVEAVAEAAQGITDWEEAIPVLRKAIEPYDTVGPNYRELSMDARRPSRTKAIEELPVALGFVLVSEGDVRRAVLGGTNYGRDADSIASMAGAITGALQGRSGVPQDWVADIAEASKTDLLGPGRVMAAVAQDIRAADAERWARRNDVLEKLTR